MTQRKYDAVLFDLDGTLLNTLPTLSAAVNASLSLHGFPVRTVGEVRQFLGNGVRRLIEQAVPADADESEAEAVLQAFRTYYAEHVTEGTEPYAGIVRVLQALKENAILTGIVSNKFSAATEALANHFFGPLIDVAIGESATLKRKPSPDMIFEAGRRLNVATARTVYVGDSEVDIATAANAGLDVIVVTWGFRDESFLRKCAPGATFVHDAASLGIALGLGRDATPAHDH